MDPVGDGEPPAPVEGVEEEEAVVPDGPWAPWTFQCAVQMEGFDGATCSFPVAPDASFEDVAACLRAADGFGDGLDLFYDKDPGRGGLVLVKDEASWASLFQWFKARVSRSQGTLTAIKLAACKVAAKELEGLTAQEMWDANPYGNTVQGMKSLLAIAHDVQTQGILLRHCLTQVLAVIGRKWEEGTLATELAVRFLTVLSASPQMVGILGRVKLFETITKALRFAEPGSPVEGVVVDLACVLAGHPRSRMLVTQAEGFGVVLRIALSNMPPSPTRTAALQLVAAVLPSSDTTLCAMVAPYMENVLQLWHSDSPADRTSLAVVLPLMIMNGWHPTVGAVHTMMLLALWSVGLDGEEVIPAAEAAEAAAKRRAEVGSILSEETKESEADAEGAAWRAAAVAAAADIPTLQAKQEGDDTPSYPPPTRRSHAQRRAAPHIVLALWGYVAQVKARQEADPGAFTVDEDLVPAQKKPKEEHYGFRDTSEVPDEPVELPPALSVRHQIGRMLCVLEVLLAQPDASVSASVLGSLSHVLVLATEVPDLEDLRVVTRLLVLAPRIVTKLRRAEPASAVHRCGVALLCQFARVLKSREDIVALRDAGTIDVLVASAGHLLQRYQSLTSSARPPSPKAAVYRKASGRGAPRVGAQKSVDRLPPKKPPVGRVPPEIARQADAAGLCADRAAASSAAMSDVLEALRHTTSALMLMAPYAATLEEEDVDTIVQLLAVADPQVLSYSTLAVWGLAHNQANRVLATSADALPCLAAWNAALLMVTSGGDPAMPEPPTVVTKFAQGCGDVLALQEQIVATMWLLLTTSQGAEELLIRELIPGLIDVIATPSVPQADLQYLALSAVWAAVLSDPVKVMGDAIDCDFPRALYRIVMAAGADLPAPYRLYAMRCLLSLSCVDHRVVLEQLVPVYGARPMEMALLSLLDLVDMQAQVEATALLASFTQRSSREFFGKSGAPKRLLDLVQHSGHPDVMVGSLYCLLGLSTVVATQDLIGRIGLPVLFEVSRAHAFPHLAAIAIKVIANLSSHKANRSRLYRAELFYRALDRNCDLGSLTDADRTYIATRLGMPLPAAPTLETRRSSAATGSTVPPPTNPLVAKISEWVDGLDDTPTAAPVEAAPERPTPPPTHHLTYTPAVVAFPPSMSTESWLAETLPPGAVAAATAVPTVEEPSGPDTTFYRPPGHKVRPLHLTLCEKLANLRALAPTGGVEEASVSDDEGAEMFPAGTGAGFDPGRTGHLKKTVLVPQGLRASSMMTSQSAPGLKLVPPSLAADANTAVSLGGYNPEDSPLQPNKPPLRLTPVVKQRWATVSTVKATPEAGDGGDGGHPKPRTHTKLKPVKSQPHVGSGTKFTLQRDKTTIPVSLLPPHLRQGPDGDRARKMLAKSPPRRGADGRKKLVGTRVEVENSDDEKDVNVYVSVQERRFVPGRAVQLPPVSPVTEPGRAAHSGKGWWQGEGSPWDVNVGSYVLASVSHVPDKLLATGGLQRAERQGDDALLASTLAMERASSSAFDAQEYSGNATAALSTGGTIGRGDGLIKLDDIATPRPAPLNNPMKVTTGAGTSRHTVKFHWHRASGSGGDHGDPTVTMHKFEHVPGCTMCLDMYPHYTLPDGRVVHFYHTDKLHETVFDYVNSGPPLPITLDVIRCVSYPEVPPVLVPTKAHLPLGVEPPRVRLAPDASLPRVEHRLQFWARPAIPVDGAAAAYEVDAAVWKERSELSESKDYVNAVSVLWQAFDGVWQTMKVKEFLGTMVHLSFSAPELCSADTIVDEAKALVRGKCTLVRRLFDMHAARGLEERPPYFMNLQDLMEFIDMQGLVGSIGFPAALATRDAILEVALPKTMRRRDHNLTFPEFLECLLRIAGADRHHTLHPPESFNAALSRLLDLLEARCPKDSNLADADHYRRTRLYTPGVNAVLKKRGKVLRALFRKFGTERSTADIRMMTLRDWVKFLEAFELFDEFFTLREAQMVFSFSRMVGMSEDIVDTQCLYFTDFMEALCRTADLVCIPTDMDLTRHGFVTPLQWRRLIAKDQMRARRLSMEWPNASARPLHEKLAKFLDVMCLSLDVTMGTKSGKLSRHAVKRFTFKQAELPDDPAALPLPPPPSERVLLPPVEDGDPPTYASSVDSGSDGLSDGDSASVEKAAAVLAVMSPGSM